MDDDPANIMALRNLLTRGIKVLSKILNPLSNILQIDLAFVPNPITSHYIPLRLLWCLKGSGYQGSSVSSPSNSFLFLI
jgi:hypothetical protein